ncbi:MULTISPECIES: hypothetical protein [unclassified Paenibacillus]|uniref:hypothetical protein n=1 Tax=unclassified Paenibacillus TaxID=185978 RepID=UPI000CFAC2D0|nr:MULTISPECIES: hypothetical protein [unclassified Paenibacillus]PRA04819.1 hypothetical protein CQ043_12225 [Paenibacillus sp. MYb63]PRA47836.1 hypothetical protein CQ061_14605 [Paenibacillus sp. MYb67]UOK65374.1 hypothetical protein MT997_14115 [Paenibacillus sp. OVF10]
MADIIQPLMLDYAVTDADSHFDHALVNVSGELVEFPIHNTVISGRSIRKYVFLNDTQVIGKQILGASLMDNQGRTLANQPLNVVKNDRGFLIGFEFSIKLEVKAIV